MFVYVYCLCLLGHTRTEWFLCGRKCARFCKVGCIIIFFSRHTAFAVVTCDGSYTRERPMLIDTSPDRPHINAVMRILFTCQSYRIWGVQEKSPQRRLLVYICETYHIYCTLPNTP